MTSRLLYLSILIIAVFAAIISFGTGEINVKVTPAAFNRYELFGFFYFSIVYVIYSAANSQNTESENISLNPLGFMGQINP